LLNPVLEVCNVVSDPIGVQLGMLHVSSRFILVTSGALHLQGAATSTTS
jgi:hypothetical protein